MTVSDIIEQFILDCIGSGSEINISRNQLAEHFNCVPSQINYVLSTRFGLENGFITESRRGGGGSITIIKIQTQSNDYITELLRNENITAVSYMKCGQIVSRLLNDGILTDRESMLILSAVSDRALLVDDKIKDGVRARIFKSMLAQLVRCEQK